MGLRSALVDKARPIYEVEDTTQDFVEGEPPSEQQRGEWFPCRLTVQEPTEGVGMGRRAGTKRTYHITEQTAELLMGLIFEDESPLTDDEPGTGNFIAFGDDTVLQIESEASPDEYWSVMGGIAPIRKKRRVIGYRCQLRRTREPVTVVDAPLKGETEPEHFGVSESAEEQTTVVAGPVEAGL